MPEKVQRHVLNKCHSARQCNGGIQPLSGQSLTISVYGIPPFLYKNQDVDKKKGILIDVIKTLSSYHNFNYEIIVSDDWFKFGPNGTIGGSLGLVRHVLSKTIKTTVLVHKFIIIYQVRG